MDLTFLSTAALAALAASRAPALAQFAAGPTAPDPAQVPFQFLAGIALMAAAGAVIVWQGAALAL